MASDLWGTVPTWLTFAGVVIATATYISSRLDAIRRPASNVFAVVPRYAFGGSSRTQDPFTMVRIENGSDMPIFDCRVAVWDWGARRRRLWRVRRRGDWLASERIAGRVFPSISARGHSEDADLPGLGLPMDGRRLGDLEVAPPVLLTFRDGNGRRWVRWPDGRLTRERPCRRRSRLSR
jgi:hypothetical protein